MQSNADIIHSQINAAKLTASPRLNLSCGLKEFPTEIFELADTLEILDLSGNQLSTLPDDLSRLHKLRILFCSNNHFSELPESLGKCANLTMVGFKSNQINKVSAKSLSPSLRWLILTDNRIEILPPEIGQCTQLQKLMLAGNQLKTLPDAMSNCKNLELLRIAANQLTDLPQWLFALPKLAWLAYAGNPCCEGIEKSALLNHPILDIHWSELTPKNKLGEGASGVIHQAIWQKTSDYHQPVALKIFKGNITSDGLPHSEKTACITAGCHPNLITIHGKIHGHPNNSKGLVMSLVDPEFTNLGYPPSLESCTRDLYDAETTFSLENIIKIAYSIASAINQLHSKGILHGDLYAHNILQNRTGDCLLGDFGAASFFSTQDLKRAHALQRIEVRAYACLLEELLDRCNTTEQLDKLKTLRELQQRCMQTHIAERPLLADILNILEPLKQSIQNY